RVDARLLARLLLSGLIPEAYPRPGDQRELLRLLRHRTTLVRSSTRLAGRIHSQLHQQRLMLSREKLLRQATRGWLRETAWPRLTAEQQAIVTTHLELIDQLTPLIQALERRIATAAGANPTAALLATIPGIGPYRSLLLAAELSPLTRFPRVEHLASDAGLAPVTRSSPHSPVSRAYAQLTARLGWRVSRVAAARKLLRIVYIMLRRGEAWRSEQVAGADVRDEVHV